MQINKSFKTNLGTLYNMDALKFIKTLPHNSIDLIITDPPYLYNNMKIRNNSKDKFSKAKNKLSKELINNNLLNSYDIITYLNEFKRISKNKFFIIFYNRNQLYTYLEWINNNKYFKFRVFTWIKTTPMPTRVFMKEDREEAIIIYYCNSNSKIRIPNYSKMQSSFWIGSTYKPKNLRFHPTVKPLEMIRILITKFSNENSIILDPFMGSGTTAIACEELQRKWLGTEINNEFYTQSIEIIKKINND